MHRGNMSTKRENIKGWISPSPFKSYPFYCDCRPKSLAPKGLVERGWLARGLYIKPNRFWCSRLSDLFQFAKDFGTTCVERESKRGLSFVSDIVQSLFILLKTTPETSALPLSPLSEKQ